MQTNLIPPLLLLCLVPVSLFAKAVVRHERWDGNILVLTYNNEEMRFLGWTPDAKYFWENGSLPRQDYALAVQSEINSLTRSVNELNQTLIQNNETIRRNQETIAALQGQIAQQNTKMQVLHTRASTHVWSDLKGQEFVGTLIDYELGVARIRKLSDGVTYSIPVEQLSQSSAELALALDQMR